MLEIIQKIQEKTEDNENFLDSEDFANLVDSIAILAKTQGDIINIENTVHDLKQLLKEESDPELTYLDQMELENVLEAVEDLVQELSSERYDENI